MTADPVMSSMLKAHDGLELAVRSTGAGEPVVLLHGATLDASWNWERPGIARAIVDAGYRVVMPDLRGHGASGKPLDAGAFSLDAFTADVRDVLDAFELARTTLVGYSLGSIIALQSAALDTRVVAVVAGGLAMEFMQPEPLSPERETYVAELAAHSDEDVTDPRAQATRAWDRSQGLDPKARAALIRGLRLPRNVDLESVRVPTLVVNGNGDPAPDSLVARLANARGARVMGDHASALDDPMLPKLIIEFMKEHHTASPT